MSHQSNIRMRPWTVIWTAVIIACGGLATYASSVQITENKRQKASAERMQKIPAVDVQYEQNTLAEEGAVKEASDLPPTSVYHQQGNGKDVVPLEGEEFYEEGAVNSSGQLSQGDIDDSGDTFSEQPRRQFWPYFWDFLAIPDGASFPLLLPGNGASGGSGSGYSVRPVPARFADPPPSS